MIIIESGGSFVNKGAIVPDEREVKVIIEALREKRDRAIQNYGKNCNCGEMSLRDVNILIGEFEKYKIKRGV